MFDGCLFAQVDETINAGYAAQQVMLQLLELLLEDAELADAQVGLHPGGD